MLCKRDILVQYDILIYDIYVYIYLYIQKQKQNIHNQNQPLEDIFRSLFSMEWS